MSAHGWFTAVIAAALLVPTLFVASASGLSCAAVDIRDALREADAAFIGRRVDVPQIQDPRPQDLPMQFAVETWVKGDFGSPVTVASAWTQPQPGQRVALILSLHDGVLRVNDCANVEPEVLLAIIGASAEPESDAPAALLIAGDFGASRMMALDAEGLLVGYGDGEGTVESIVVCPGGQRVVELGADHEHQRPWFVAVRDVATMEIMSEIRLGPMEELPGAPVCRDGEASDMLMYLGGIGIVQLADQTVLHPGDWAGVTLGAGLGVISERLPVPEGEIERIRLLVLDLATGVLTPLYESPEEPTYIMSLALSPGGAHVGLVEQPVRIAARDGLALHLFDTRQGRLLSTRNLPLPDECFDCWSQLVWADDARLVLRTQGPVGDEGGLFTEVRLLDVPDLTDAGEPWSGWQAAPSVAAAGLLLGIDRSDGLPWLLAAPLSGGEAVAVRAIDTLDATALAALPGFDEAAGVALLTAAAERTPAPTPEPAAAPGPEPETVSASAIAAGALAAVLVVFFGASLARRRMAR